MPTPAELARQAEQFDSAQWFDFLDEVDAAARRRRRREPAEPDVPAGHDRAAVAAWIARKHFSVDVSIAAIWHLPTNAPADEIRLLEVAERSAGPDVAELGAVDYRLDIDGCPYRLFVADADGDQLEQIKSGKIRLPAGWSIEQASVWRRGCA